MGQVRYHRVFQRDEIYNQHKLCCVEGCEIHREKIEKYCYLHQRPEEESEEHKERMCYFIKSEDDTLLKIGKSRDIGARLASLQTGSPQKLVLIGMFPNNGNLEKKLHKRLRQYRTHGEWFKIEGEIEELLCIVRSGDDIKLIKYLKS